MLQCPKCARELPEDAVLCCYCGRKLNTQKKPRTRGNGLGSVYKSPSGTWTAEITIGWYMQDGTLKRKRRRKYGFKTKKAAAEYIAELKAADQKRDRKADHERRQKAEIDLLFQPLPKPLHAFAPSPVPVM